MCLNTTLMRQIQYMDMPLFPGNTAACLCHRRCGRNTFPLNFLLPVLGFAQLTAAAFAGLFVIRDTFHIFDQSLFFTELFKAPQHLINCFVSTRFYFKHNQTFLLSSESEPKSAIRAWYGPNSGPTFRNSRQPGGQSAAVHSSSGGMNKPCSIINAGLTGKSAFVLFLGLPVLSGRESVAVATQIWSLEKVESRAHKDRKKERLPPKHCGTPALLRHPRSNNNL